MATSTSLPSSDALKSTSPELAKQKRLHVCQANRTETTSYDRPSKKAKTNTSANNTPDNTPDEPTSTQPPVKDSAEQDEEGTGEKYPHCKLMQHQPARGCAADEKAF